MNIKNEIKLITFWWILFSFIYFLFVLVPKTMFSDEAPDNFFKSENFIILASLVGILLRNLAAFLTQSMMTLYQVYSKGKFEYSNEFLRGKQKVLDIDVIMSYQLTFEKFKMYVEENFNEDQNYLTLYCFIRIYRNKIRELKDLLEQDDIANPKEKTGTSLRGSDVLSSHSRNTSRNSINKKSSNDTSPDIEQSGQQKKDRKKSVTKRLSISNKEKSKDSANKSTQLTKSMLSGNIEKAQVLLGQ